MDKQEAKKILKGLHDTSALFSVRTALETVFPELAESEDERIREDLIQWINEFPDTIWRGHYKKDVIAWLEKQGEHKEIICDKCKMLSPIREDKHEPLFDIEYRLGLDY